MFNPIPFYNMTKIMKVMHYLCLIKLVILLVIMHLMHKFKIILFVYQYGATYAILPFQTLKVTMNMLSVLQKRKNTDHPQEESNQEVIGLNLKLSYLPVQTDWTNQIDRSE